MAGNHKRRRKRRQKKEYPAWLWMLFGLSIGLAVAFAVYVNDRALPTPQPTTEVAPPLPSSALDNGAPVTSEEEEVRTPPPPQPRFDFYKMLPNYEVVIAEETPDVEEDLTPQAIVEPGEYVLQAGSFSSFEDADRRRAELALHGIESSIQRVSIDSRRYHRVWIGPTNDLDELNTVRSRLREAKIDVMRIRLGD